MASTKQAAAKPVLVMLHAFALDARMWRRQVEALSEEFRVLTLDLPGFGPQARDVGEVEPAVEVARAMDALGLVKAHFVGASYGGAVAIDLALRSRARVQSLTLVAPMMLGKRLGIEAWGRCVSLANEGDKTTAAEIWMDDPLFETLRQDETLFEEVRQIVLDYGGAHWTGKVSSKWSDPDPAAKLKALDIPTMVVSGEADIPSFVLMAEAYAKALPRAKREIVQGVGHMVNIEAPETFNELLRDFVKGV
jgi:pimeloyl-ACP methyl ester carboxylesterase